MEHVVFRPYWNPPNGIAAKEIVPRARRDSSYLDAIVAGRLVVRQKPGPGNSLGLAKFIFPRKIGVRLSSDLPTTTLIRTGSAPAAGSEAHRRKRGTLTKTVGRSWSGGSHRPRSIASSSWRTRAARGTFTRPW